MMSDSSQFLHRITCHLVDHGNRQREAKTKLNTSHGSSGGQKENCRQNADVIKRVGTNEAAEEAFCYALGFSDHF